MTGQDILQAEFEKAGMRGGYKADQVDEFLSNIAKFVDSQENDKSELEYKIKILAEKIEQYKREEDNMKEVLIGAQTHGKRVIDEAKIKAEEMIKQTEVACEKSLNEAKKKSEILTENSLNKVKAELSEIQRECNREREILDKLKIETSKFRKSILDQYKAHIAAVQNLPSVVDQSLGINKDTNTENKAKQILREEESKVKTRPAEVKPQPAPTPAPKPKQESKPSRPIQISKPKVENDDDIILTEESRLEKSKTLEFDRDNININSKQGQEQPLTIVQPTTQPKSKKQKLKQESEKSKGKPSNNAHGQTERPDYLKKFGELEFGKNQR